MFFSASCNRANLMINARTKNRLLKRDKIYLPTGIPLRQKALRSNPFCLTCISSFLVVYSWFCMCIYICHLYSSCDCLSSSHGIYSKKSELILHIFHNLRKNIVCILSSGHYVHKFELYLHNDKRSILISNVKFSFMYLTIYINVVSRNSSLNFWHFQLLYILDPVRT